MATLEDALAGEHVFVEIPRGGVRDWIAACEVMIQERLRAWAFPIDRLGEVPDAVAIFGRRARVGVHGALQPPQVADAFAAGAHFVTSPVCSPELIAAAGGRPFIAGGLTPREVGEASMQGATAVQVIPGDVLGMAYSRTLPSLLPDVPLIATGRFERFLAEMWLQGGALAVGLSQNILLPEMSQHGEALPDADENDLDDVRRRCQSMSDLAVH